MKASDVYLKAAKLVFESNYSYASCLAIENVNPCDGGWRMEATEYMQIFSPEEKILPGSVWGIEWGNTNIEVKKCRVLALLFMREIALDQERNEK